MAFGKNKWGRRSLVAGIVAALIAIPAVSFAWASLHVVTFDGEPTSLTISLAGCSPLPEGADPSIQGDCAQREKEDREKILSAADTMTAPEFFTLIDSLETFERPDLGRPFPKVGEVEGVHEVLLPYGKLVKVDWTLPESWEISAPVVVGYQETSTYLSVKQSNFDEVSAILNSAPQKMTPAELNGLFAKLPEGVLSVKEPSEGQIAFPAVDDFYGEANVSIKFISDEVENAAWAFTVTWPFDVQSVSFDGKPSNRAFLFTRLNARELAESLSEFSDGVNSFEFYDSFDDLAPYLTDVEGVDLPAAFEKIGTHTVTFSIPVYAPEGTRYMEKSIKVSWPASRNADDNGNGDDSGGNDGNDNGNGDGNNNSDGKGDGNSNNGNGNANVANPPAASGSSSSGQSRSITFPTVNRASLPVPDFSSSGQNVAQGAQPARPNIPVTGANGETDETKPVTESAAGMTNGPVESVEDASSTGFILIGLAGIALVAAAAVVMVRRLA